MNPRGMDFWVGSWVDGTPGAQLFWYDGAAWNNIGDPPFPNHQFGDHLLPFANLGKPSGTRWTLMFTPPAAVPIPPLMR